MWEIDAEELKKRIEANARRAGDIACRAVGSTSAGHYAGAIFWQLEAADGRENLGDLMPGSAPLKVTRG